MRLVPLAAVCLHLVGCAPELAVPTPAQADVQAERRRQYAEGAKHMLAYWSRAADVTSALRIAGAELCGQKVRAALGVIAISDGDLPWLFGRGGFWHEFRDVFEASLSIDGRVRVIHVTAGAPGDVAGVRTGDVILRLGGRSVGGLWSLPARQASERAAAFELRVERAGTETSLQVTRVPECWYEIGLVAGSFPNAFADGRNVYVSTALLREAQNDDELAIVIGHELAHNFREHLPDEPHIAGYVRKEEEADYLGCYFAARAGYDVARAPGYWRRLAREYPGLVSDDASFTHTGTATRAAALAHTVAEIQRKQSAGLPLLPDMAP
jgi:beta-barrel assembly-enhancing protease